MTNKQKRKGTKFENDATEILNDLVEDSEWKRIAGSGALGTILNEPLLTGDISGKIKHYPKKFRLECKVGYSHGAKQTTIYKEWLDKIAKEAESAYALPGMIGKFENTRSGVKEFVVLDVKVFAEMLNQYTTLKKELDLVYQKLQEVAHE